MIKYFNGIPIMIENTITTDCKEEKYYISYNPYKRDYGIDTTALVITIGDNERQVFYILKGNHSEQYENCKDLKESISYFANNKESIHQFSNAFEH
jgi:hypothetical protein